MARVLEGDAGWWGVGAAGLDAQVDEMANDIAAAKTSTISRFFL